MNVPRESVTADSTWSSLGADSFAVLKVLVSLEAQFDLAFDDEAAAAAAATPGACAELLAGRVAAADARARAGPLAGADDVEALAAKSAFFQFSTEMAESASGGPPKWDLNTGRGWEVEDDEDV